MRRATLRPIFAVVLTTSIACLGTACTPAPSSGTGGSESSSSTTSVAPANSTGSASSTGSADSTSATAPASETGPMLTFGDNAAGAQLVADMEAGKVPSSCTVLYDQMGSLPEVTVTDPETISHIYELTKAITVLRPSNMSITDNYHRVSFTLQDGTTVGYPFEGVGNYVLGSTNYFVSGDGPLWTLVQQLQGGEPDTQGVEHAIRVNDPDKIVLSCPTTALSGDIVSLQLREVLDAFVTVKVDGEEIYSSSSVGWTFLMPDHDATVDVTVTGYDFGS